MVLGKLYSAPQNAVEKERNMDVESPREPAKFRTVLEMTRDSATLLRDATIVVLLLGLVFGTGQFKGIAERLGLTEVDFGGLKIELGQSRTATQSAAGQIAMLQSQAINLDSALQDLEKAAQGTKLASQVDALGSSLTQILSLANSANDVLGNSLWVQNTLANTAAPGSVGGGKTGWILAGTVDQSKKSWKGDSPPSVQLSTPVITTLPTSVTLTKTLLLYADE
jgi:hypothetical protein